MNAYEMMVSSGLDWKVGKEKGILDIDGTKIKTGRDCIFRYREEKKENGEIIRVPLDSSAITVVGSKWNILQNEEFISYVDSWAGRNHFKIHSMGSMGRHSIVYVMVDVDSGFSLFSGKDIVSSYFVFSLFHKYGKSVSVSFDQIRQLSGARFTLNLRNDKHASVIRISHRHPFDLYQQLREPLAFAHSNMNHYKERAELLSRRRFDEGSVRKFINDVYPLLGTKRVRRSIFNPHLIPLSIPGKKIYRNLYTQPGAELAPFSWWNALNSVFYTIDMDPSMGHDDDTQKVSAFYEDNREKKTKAMELAMEYALGNR